MTAVIFYLVGPLPLIKRIRRYPLPVSCGYAVLWTVVLACVGSAVWPESHGTEVGILAGVILAFARAMGEFGATIMLAGNIPGKTQTMALAVYTAVQAGNRSAAYAWSLLIVVLSALAMIGIHYFERMKQVGEEDIF